MFLGVMHSYFEEFLCVFKSFISEVLGFLRRIVMDNNVLNCFGVLSISKNQLFLESQNDMSEISEVTGELTRDCD